MATSLGITITWANSLDNVATFFAMADFESTWDFPKLAGHLLTSEVHDVRLEVLFFMLDSLEGREPAGMREFDEFPAIVSENVECMAVDEKRKTVVLESIRNNLLNLLVEMIVSRESHPLYVVQVGLKIKILNYLYTTGSRYFSKHNFRITYSLTTTRCSFKLDCMTLIPTGSHPLLASWYQFYHHHHHQRLTSVAPTSHKREMQGIRAGTGSDGCPQQHSVVSCTNSTTF